MGRLPQSRMEENAAARRIRDAPPPFRPFPVKHFTFACGRSIIEASSKE